MTTVAQTICDLSLEKIRGPGEEKDVKVRSLWKNQTVMIHILRRFGCRINRSIASELSKLTPILEAKNIRVVAVGIEHVGLQDFVDGDYWKGELYVDNGKKIQNALKIKSVGYFSAAGMLFNKDVKEALSKTKDVPGDLKGDGLQLGATFVISKTGETLLDFRQKRFSDHPTKESILEACGLDPALATTIPASAKHEEICADNTCSA